MVICFLAGAVHTVLCSLRCITTHFGFPRLGSIWSRHLDEGLEAGFCDSEALRFAVVKGCAVVASYFEDLACKTNFEVSCANCALA